MKVRISYTVDADVDLRRAINKHYGRDGLATREGVRSWYEEFGSSMDGDLSSSSDFDDGHVDYYDRNRSGDGGGSDVCGERIEEG